MRHRTLITMLGLSAWACTALAGNASTASSSSASHPAAIHGGGTSRTLGGGALHDAATARSIIGESAASYSVTKQSFLGHDVEVTSFASPRPLTPPERRRLNHAGFVVTRATQDNNVVYYCRKSLDLASHLDCFGPESGR
jgi:hypothetical protein